MAFRQRGEGALALEQFDELQKQHPDYTAGYQMAAQMLTADGKLPEAEQRLQAGIAAARRTGNRHAMAEMEGMLDEIRNEIQERI